MSRMDSTGFSPSSSQEEMTKKAEDDEEEGIFQRIWSSISEPAGDNGDIEVKQVDSPSRMRANYKPSSKEETTPDPEYTPQTLTQSTIVGREPGKQPAPKNAPSTDESKDSKEKKDSSLAGRLNEARKKVQAEFKPLYTQLEKKIDQAESNMEKREAAIDKKELIQELSHAVAQIGAAMHGLKTGTDMSGLEFTKKDFDKERDRVLKRFRDKVADIAAQRREAKSQEAAAGRDVMTVAGMEQRSKESQKDRDLQRELAGAKAKGANQKALASLSKDQREKAMKVLDKIRVTSTQDNSDKEAKAEAIKGYLVAAGVPKEEAQAAAFDEVMFSLIDDPDPADMDEVYQRVLPLMEKYFLGPATTSAPTPATQPAMDTNSEYESMINKVLADPKNRGASRADVIQALKDNNQIPKDY